MSARPDVHPGPRVRVIPRAVAATNEADDAIFLASAYGLVPDDWQQGILFGWLGRRADGKWCAGKCGLAVPRQNGKNGALEVRELFGMVVLGERFLHTAHEVKTARKAFKRLKHFFGEKANDADAKYPELNALVLEVRNTNGQEAIVLADVYDDDGNFVRSGGAIEFVARSKGSGRGFTVDVLVLDEAQDLQDDEIEALLPTVSASPLKNPQVIFLGTPPNADKGQTGEVFTRIRSSAGTDERLCWIDFGAADGPMPDIDDEAALWFHNPALYSGRLQVEVCNDERTILSDEGYARERFGWWGDPDASALSVVDVAEWANLVDRSTPMPSRAAVVIDVAPDRKWSTVGIGAAGENGRTLVMVQTKPGTGTVVDSLTKMRDAGRELAEVALTPGQAEALGADLKAAGFEYRVLTNKDVGAGCAAFITGVPERRFVHVGQNEIAAAIKNARTRLIGEVEVWDRRHAAVDISAVVAGATAAHRWSLLAAAPARSAYEDNDLLIL